MGWVFVRVGSLSTLTAIVLACLTVEPATAAPSARKIAQRVDQALAEEVFDEQAKLAPRCDDATFLRRVWLDLVGDIPAPEDVIAFQLDPSANKRARIVRQLFASPHYGQNWARYWRDVVFFRRIEDRSLLAANAMEVDLAEQLNANVGWDKIASEFITASGDVRDNGSTAIVMAQDGRTEEVTAEVSRIFLGIHLQCAQCHDHPYDRWKREQFHELAAFFPRVGLRQLQSPVRRSFEVYASNRDRGRLRPNDNNSRPAPEHLMRDLEDPSAPGAKMQPKFFLTSGASLPLGTEDARRRQQLAQWLTDNQWFSIALVNRLWSELVGEGFYEPIDDIGPDRQALSPAAVKLLAYSFRKNEYNLKWLLRTICSTEAYQRDSRPRRGPEGTALTANVPQPLRSDQLFNALLSALEVDEDSLGPNSRAAGARRRETRRMQFAAVFGYDPSISREEIAASIPQMLALMNSDQVHRGISAETNRTMARLLDTVEDEEALTVELYLRCLSRQPTEAELTEVFFYSQEVDNRREVFEDLLWALLNSAEFQHRR